MGRLPMVSVRDETKMGDRPGTPAGNLGMEGVVLAVVTAVSFSSSFWSLSFWSCCLCRCRSLAWKGFGLRSLRLEMMEGCEGSALWVGVGSTPGFTDEALVGEAEAAAEDLLLWRASRLELARPKAGVGWSTLAGVAMSVGVTSLLVMMATVVLVARGLAAILARVRPKRLGRMTGVKALGLALLEMDDGFATAEEDTSVKS